ncbi:MAG: multicopper oxidase family protein [Ornithinimicrobium sp.]
MKPLTRRQFAVLGGLGAGATLTGGAGLWWAASNGSEYAGGEDFGEPPVLASRDGILELDLTAGLTRTRIGAREATVETYNGSLPGPTLRVSAGDTIRIAMTNSLETVTNLHVHGLHVSPDGNGDNPFLSIAPSETFDYEFTLPEDHPPGTYWYHPHHHGTVADQVAAGLYGAIIVTDPSSDPEPVPVTRERLMVVSDLSLDASGDLAGADVMEQMVGREGEIVLVNGQVRPRISAALGERERWRIVNACPSRYLSLSLEGQRVQMLGRDVARFPVPEKVSEVTLLPGSRVELLIQATTGSSTLLATPVDRGDMGSMMGDGADSLPGSDDPSELLTFDVSGDAAAPLPEVPHGPALRDLRTEAVAGRRTLDFAMGMGGGMMDRGETSMMSFTINGTTFDADRTDTTVTAGAIEEWTLTNPGPMDHPVHLHVWPMQIIESGDQKVTDPTWRDVVNVPAGSQVKVLIAFDDFWGRSVYHCHILDHEDQGMMGTIEVRPAQTG